MTRRTARAKDHPPIEFEVGDVPPALTDAFVQWLERSMQAGTRFEIGQTILYGASVLKLAEGRDGRLTLLGVEPGSMPWRWIPSIEQALRDTYVQRAMVESFGLLERLDFPDVQAAAYCCARAGKSAESALLREEPAIEHESGWFVMCGDRDHDHADPDELEICSLYEMTLRFPILNAFLAMPVESAIYFGKDGFVAAFLGDRELAVEPGSLLDATRSRRLS